MSKEEKIKVLENVINIFLEINCGNISSVEQIEIDKVEELSKTISLENK